MIKFDYDIGILKSYGKEKYKLTHHYTIMREGSQINNNAENRGNVNDEKLIESISRAKSKIREYALCNEWDMFVTLTIDKNKYDRKDLKTYYKDFSQFLRNYNKNHGLNLKYIFIPELHQDGCSWHMHGLINGLPVNHLKQFTEADNVPNSLIQKGYYNWQAYSERFGYVSIDRVHDKEKVSSYITKYITKGLKDCVKDLNAKMYYCSKGLNTAETIKKGLLKCELNNPDYENDYVSVKWINGIPAEDIIKKYFSDTQIIADENSISD